MYKYSFIYNFNVNNLYMLFVTGPFHVLANHGYHFSSVYISLLHYFWLLYSTLLPGNSILFNLLPTDGPLDCCLFLFLSSTICRKHVYMGIFTGIISSMKCRLWIYFPFMATLAVYGSSWAGGQVGAIAAAYATARPTPNPSHICNLHCSTQQCWTLNPMSKARDHLCIFMDTGRVRNLLSHMGTPLLEYLKANVILFVNTLVRKHF